MGDMEDKTGSSPRRAAFEPERVTFSRPPRQPPEPDGVTSGRSAMMVCPFQDTVLVRRADTGRIGRTSI